MITFTSEVVVGSQPITGWINGNLYVPTKEVFGILPVPADVRADCGMQKFNRLFDSKQPHHFLALMQGTRKPVLPIHSIPEQHLFSKLMREEPIFSVSNSGPIWKEAAKLWNRIADTNKEISYKVCLFNLTLFQ